MAIPDWTRCAAGELTPSGSPAVFRSSAHAWFALRLVYLADVADIDPPKVAETEQLYAQRWQRFVQHGHDMVALAAAIGVGDLDRATAVWATVEQREVDHAFSTTICEREPYPKRMLQMVAHRHFGFGNVAAVAHELRDPLRKADNQTVWEAAGGVCQSCRTVTISQRQYKALRITMPAHPDLFDLALVYTQTNRKVAPLWSNRVLIAAKGVADHIVPWSQGGRTTADNLANACAGCNYSRNDSSLDVIGVARYLVDGATGATQETHVSG